MGWTAETQTTFVGQNLGSTMRLLEVLVTSRCNGWPRTVIFDPDADKYVAGIAVHWYGNFYTPPDDLTVTHTARFPIISFLQLKPVMVINQF